MNAQIFFMTVAVLSLATAGFVVVTAVSVKEGSRIWDPITRWRVKTVARESFTLVFLALALVPISSLTDDLDTTVRLGAAGIVVSSLIEMYIHRRPDPAIWVPKVSWTVYMVSSAIFLALQAANLFVASLGLLEIGFLLALFSAMGIFSNLISDLAREQPPVGKVP